MLSDMLKSLQEEQKKIIDDEDTLSPIPEDVDELPDVDLTEMHHHFHNIITQFGCPAYQDINNKEWFLARPICLKLGYADIPQAIRKLIKNPNTKMKFGDLQSNHQIINKVHPQCILIDECGFFNLLLKSKKPAAVAFVEWLSNDFLPALRKGCIEFSYDWEQNQPTQQQKQDKKIRNDLIHCIEIYSQNNYKYDRDWNDASKIMTILWKDFKQLIIQMKLNGIKSRFKSKEWKPTMKILESNATNLTVKWR